MSSIYTNGLAGEVNGKLEALQPGELRVGDSIRMFPKANQKGETVVRLHVTNEVDMLIAKNQYLWIKAWMWIAITALSMATFSGLIVHFL